MIFQDKMNIFRMFSKLKSLASGALILGFDYF